MRFVDAPEVARIAERWVTTTFDLADAPQHLHATAGRRWPSACATARTARRAKRAGEGLREKWDRR